MPIICPAPILGLISVYMARTYEKVPDRKAFLEKMAAAERNAAQIVEKTLASYSKISKKHVSGGRRTPVF